jgi:hypothetical protein
MLSDLAASGQPRSMIRRLKEHLSAIEQCVEAGYSHQAIHEWLVRAGLAISFKYYESALSRLRKAAKRPGQQTVAASRHSPAITLPQSAVAEQPGRQLRTPETKGLPNVWGIDQVDGSAGSNILVEPPARTPFKYDPTAAGKLDLKKF